MYKGNMQDFVEKVNLYIKQKFDSKIVFGKYNLTGGESYYVAFFGPGQQGAVGYEVFDTDDFEQQIYDYVNNELEDVQGQYDGFPESFDWLSGDEISESGGED